MNRDGRSPDERYDVIVVGGGIHGVMLTLQAAARGLRPLLLEAGDYGHAATWNSLRVLHGGLAGWQSGDWQQSTSAIRERAWLANQFPDLTEPLPCLWPVYGGHRSESATVRWTMLIDNAWTHLWTRQVATDRRLPASRMLSARSAHLVCSAIPQSHAGRSLRGAALWHELILTNPPRLMLELLRWATAQGAHMRNYFPVRQLVIEQQRVQGVVARDQLSGTDFTLRAPVVFDCTAGQLAALNQRLNHRSQQESWLVAVNLLLHRKFVERCGVAQQSASSGQPPLMLLPRYGRLVAGTKYCSFDATRAETVPMVSEFQVASLLNELNGTGLVDKLTLYDVAQIHSGRVRASRAGSVRPASRSAIHHFTAADGLAGLVEISSGGLTSARGVAETALHSLWPRREASPTPVPQRSLAPIDLQIWRTPSPEHRSAWIAALHQLVETEDVFCWEDLLLRRTDWAQQVDDWRGLSREISELSHQVGRPLELPLQVP
ncbi:MAG: FAD-dependent oxidoreductase [Pirellulales bacterium]